MDNIFEAIYQRNLEAVWLLAKKSVNSVEEGRTPLHAAAYRASARRFYKIEEEEGVVSDAILLAIIEAGADLNAIDEKGNTPLMVALDKGGTSPTLALIGAGADLNYQNHEGKTALMLGVEYLRLTIVDALIRAGANLSIKDRNGNTALHWVMLGFYEGRKAREVYMKIGKVLIGAGAPIDAQNNQGEPPMMLALRSIMEDFAIHLLKNGARPFLENKEGETPLIMAKSKLWISPVARKEIVQLILSKP